MHIKLHYWGQISGRSMPLIYILNHSKIDWEQIDLTIGPQDQAAWMAKKQKLIAQGFTFSNLPCLEVSGDNDQETYFVSQTNYCARFLGEKLGYDGKTEEEKRNLGQALVQFEDFQKFWFESIMTKKPKSQEQDDQMKSKLPEMLMIFENCLNIFKKKFLIADHLTTIDFLLFHWSNQMLKFKPSLFSSGYPLLEKWYSAMLNDESISETKKIHDSLPYTVQYKKVMKPMIEAMEKMPDGPQKEIMLIRMRNLPDLYYGTEDKGWDAVYE